MFVSPKYGHFEEQTGFQARKEVLFRKGGPPGLDYRGLHREELLRHVGK
jgi:hypothetical protein